MNLVKISDQHFNSYKTQNHRQAILQMVKEFYQVGNGKEKENADLKRQRR